LAQGKGAQFSLCTFLTGEKTMRIIKRVFRSFQYHKVKNGMLFLLYSVCFTLLMVMVLLNISSGQQLKDTQKAIGNAVYVRKLRTVDLGKRNNLAPLNTREIQELTSDERVESYNILVYAEGSLVSGTPYYRDWERYQEYLEMLAERSVDASLQENCTFVGVDNSRFSVFFAGTGLRLTEGDGITEEDAGEKVALVSEALARQNGWKPGDTIDLRTDRDSGFQKGTEFQAVIKGIYSLPEKTFDSDKARPKEVLENYIFLPESTLYQLNMTIYQPYMLYVYLKDPKQIESYAADMEELLGNSLVDETTEGRPQTRLMMSWNSEWNQMVSMPLKEIYGITNVALWITLAGVFAIVFFISSADLLKNSRELGVWIACGEKRSVLLVQMLLEKLLPIVLACAVALLISVSTADQIGGMLGSGIYAEMNEEMERDREETLFWEQYYDIDQELRAGNYDYYYMSGELALHQYRMEIATALGTGLLILTGLFSLQIWGTMRKQTAELLQMRE
jgi:hypothetical protein